MFRFRVSLVLVGLVVTSCASSSERGDSAVDQDPSSATSNTTVSSDSDIDSKADLSILDATPVFVDPVIDAVNSVSADVSASTGGSITLPLSGSVQATLSIPPGALDSDRTITLSPVSILADGVDGMIGVDVQPAGLWFTIDAMPRLTFSGVSNDSVVTGWDDDNVAREMASLPTSDTSVMVAMSHFSGAAIGSVGDQINTPLDELRAEIKTDLVAEQYRQLDGTNTQNNDDETRSKWSKRVVDVQLGYVWPLLEAAAAGPCGNGGQQAIHEALGLEQIAQFAQLEHDIPSSLARKVFEHDIDCAHKACEAGDPTALGQYLRAEQIRHWILNEVVDLTEGLQEFEKCSLFRVTVMGRLTWNLPTGDVNETFVAKGVVASESSEGANLLPMTVSIGGWQGLDSTGMSVLLSGLSMFGGGDGNVEVECTLEPIGPSVAQVDVSFADTDPLTPSLEPTIRFKPFVESGARKCVGYDVPYNAEITFASHMALSQFIFDGTALRHAFVSGERDQFGVYRVSETIDLGRLFPAGVGAPGTSRILMNLQPAAIQQPPSGIGLTTVGLTDVYALVAGS